MITVEPTTEDKFIKDMFLNPDIYAEMKDDNSPANPESLRSVDILALPGVFLKVLRDGVACGCFWFLWKDDHTLETHTALDRTCRGRKAIEAARVAREWIFSNTTAKEITSYAWSDSPAVDWFCRAIGMTKREVKPWPATRNGKPVAITYYAIGRTI